MAPPDPLHPPSAAPPASSEWYGNIQYLLNISAVGSASCLLLFLLVKLRSDHGRIPGPAGLASKLLAVWHAALPQIAAHCGANAAQFLLIERSSSLLLLLLSLPALLLLLPLSLSSSSSTSSFDQFSSTTISAIPRSSPLLWAHLLFSASLALSVRLALSSLSSRLRPTRFPDSHSLSLFTAIIHGVPRSLAADRAALDDYFSRRYPGKVFRVLAPFDLCSLDRLFSRLLRVRNDVSWLEARILSRSLSRARLDDTPGLRSRILELYKAICAKLGFVDADRLRRLRDQERALAEKLRLYKQGLAPGAGIAFVIFKDVYTTNKAVQDFRAEKKRRRPTGQFFSVMELRLERSRWKVERAPHATDIYWNHLGSSKLSLNLRRVAVNTCLLLMLLFCSSPLAIITAVKSAARIINAEAVDHAQSWLAWLESSSWAATVIFQFLPNVIIFVSMYIIIPSVLSSLSKFERHLTVSGEQRAALLKMVCFFLVNLIILRGLVESSLESWILRMGRCYLEERDCQRIEQYMSGSFLSKSCLSSLAFLIMSTFLGISYDLLAPIPWIKNKLQKFRKNDMLLLVPEQSEEYPLENQGEDALQRPLMSGRDSGISAADDDDIANASGMNGIDLRGQGLSVFPIDRSAYVPKQTFDFAQYYAFNLTIFALTLIYSAFAPLVVPVGAIYFGYRYVVDKYNFLFVYRVRGFPACNDGKLMDIVLCIMHFCVVLFLLSMLLFFSVQGDSMKLQAITTLGLLLLYKLLPLKDDGFQSTRLENMHTVDNVVDGPTDYEVFSQPRIDWDMYQI